ncbi:hypothetical protein RND81_14G043000 [Saponaria officinalis]|uniref:HTH myb-type domain-containing protein n=1 Tax=Saponaria officinalis TaxID=3572 RepID=A0AAW1GNC5_SAPOF
MREDDSNWFSKWEDELPSPEELMPLSQTLITPDLASAFDIRNHGGCRGGGGVATPPSLFHHHHQSSSSPQLFHHHHHNYGGQQSSSTPQPPPTHPNSSEFDSSSAELGGGGGGGVGSELEPARTLKRPRLVWTPQLHKRFVDAVAHLGIKNAVPKTIMQLMSVDGLTRENVASHLQKYRLYLKRMQGGGVNSGGVNGPGGLVGSGDPATDRLFASSPVPAHFLHQPNGGGAGGPAVGNGHGPGPVASGVRPNSDHFMSYMPVAALHHQQIQAQYRHMGHFGTAQGGNGQFEHPFLSRQTQLCPNRNGLLQNNSGFVEDVESSAANNGGRKVLTLFPTADD